MIRASPKPTALRFRQPASERPLEPAGDESLPALHQPAGRDLVADGRDPVERTVRVQVPAAVLPARGRLSDHPGSDLLSRREPGSDDFLGHRAVGAPVRADARPEPDDLRELGRRVRRDAAIQPGSRPRCSRAGGAGSHQRGGQRASQRPADASDLRQIQSGRRAHHDPRGHLQDAQAHRSRGSELYAACAKDLATYREWAS